MPDHYALVEIVGNSQVSRVLAAQAALAKAESTGGAMSWFAVIRESYSSADGFEVTLRVGFRVESASEASHA
jgi:flavin-binding protein dodecin